MGQIAYRANLSAAIYPMTIADGGRTVIMPGPDQNFDRRVDPQGEQKDAGIPQALYMENVMPTSNGYQSVGYRDTGNLPAKIAPGPGVATTRQVMPLFFGDASNPKVITVAFRNAPSSVENIATDFQAIPTVWTPCTGADVFSGNFAAGISNAYVRGTNYLCDGVSVYKANNPSGNVVDFTNIGGTITGITVADIISICSCANYLIALLKDGTVAWSSTTTPTDFTASLVSGAGSIIPADIQSPVSFLTEAPNGFYIYCITGVIYAAYTGNSRYPFKFSAIENAGGYTYATQVNGNRTKNTQYAIDDSFNIHVINPNGATLIAAELSTFLERQVRYDLFNSSTNEFSFATFDLTDFPNTTPTLYFALDKYLFLRVGIYFIVYDILLQRYGKLKASFYLAFKQDTVNTEIYFIPTTGAVNVMSFDQYDTNYTHSGVLLLGKFQYVRSRKIQLHKIEIEGPQNTAIIPSPNFSCFILPSLDGRTFDVAVTPYQVSNSGGLASYTAHTTAQNHSILLKGAFNVNTLQLRFSPRGDR